MVEGTANGRGSCVQFICGFRRDSTRLLRSVLAHPRRKECLGKTLEKKDIENLSAILELSEEEIKEIGRAKERREKASYSGSVSFEKHLAEMTLDDARKFINKVADILEK